MSLNSAGFNQSRKIRCLLTTRHATSFTDARHHAVSVITYTGYCLDGRSRPETEELSFVQQPLRGNAVSDY